MAGQSWQGVQYRYSVKGKYRIDTYSTVEKNGVKYHAAIVLKAVRAYWEPVIQGINLLDSELERYYNEDA